MPNQVEEIDTWDTVLDAMEHLANIVLLHTANPCRPMFRDPI